MTRRTRRRITVLVLAAVAGAGSPLWGPPLLRSLPTFQVDEIRVTGIRYLDAGEVRRMAAIPAGASVWDEAGEWEERVRRHRLVEEVRVARRGWSTLEIQVTEARPVALVIVGGGLRPVDRDGTVMPLDPTRHNLDLPVLRGEPEVRGDRVRSPRQLRELEAMAELGREDSAFLARVSEVHPVPGGGMQMWMMEEAPVERVLLPLDRTVRSLERVEIALGLARRPVRAADARFQDQVVLRTEETP